ncbi:MAG: GTPase ObgE [Chloroflexota bacterium]|nr:GTPase ObgE [Chloroflexota bacterium]
MIIDGTEMLVTGGAGGDGSISLHHERYLPWGGPDGGDGGKGGDVFIMASSEIDGLIRVYPRRRFAGGKGEPGSKGKKHGRDGENAIVRVPLGTLVFVLGNSDEKRLVADLTTSGQKVLVAMGGRGGLGNIHYATAVRQAPLVASSGEKGEECHIVLEVKLLTDICIIGPPNSGKSVLLSVMTGAKPEIGDYPFTTQKPVLGTITSDRDEILVAELPSLIYGSHNGKGLGCGFLRHAERAKVIIYLLDGSSTSPVEDKAMLIEEASLCREKLMIKPSIIVVNKIDLPQVQRRLSWLNDALGAPGIPVMFISALGGQGIPGFMRRVKEMISRDDVKGGPPPPVAIFHPRPMRKKGR